MAALDADGKLARHLDDYVGAMIYSMVGKSCPESQLRYQLELSHSSLRDLHRQIEDMQHHVHDLEFKYVKAKEEASLNALALKRRVGEYEALREKYEQLMKECELYHNDREIFSEAAEDAEERRADAEKRAIEAEKRAAEAQQREEAAMHLIEQLMKDSPRRLPHALPAAVDAKEQQGRHETAERVVSGSRQRFAISSEECALEERPSPSSADQTVNQAETRKTVARQPERPQHDRSPKEWKTLPQPMLSAEDQATVKKELDFRKEGRYPEASVRKRILTDEHCEIGRNNFSGAIGQENCKLAELDVRSIRQAAQSEVDRLKLEIRHLIRLIRIGQSNLLKAEREADFIQAKNWELQRLLMDTLIMFGILPQILTRKAGLSPSKCRENFQLLKNQDTASSRLGIDS